MLEGTQFLTKRKCKEEIEASLGRALEQVEQLQISGARG